MFGPDRILLILIVLLVIVIIWRGPKNLPLIGRAFGQGVKEARREINEIKADIDKTSDEGAASSPPAAPQPPGPPPPAPPPAAPPPA